MFWDTKLSKTSHIFAALTSSALTPYYSYRAQEICSTSHKKYKKHSKSESALLSALLPSYLLNFLTNFVNHYILMFLWISGSLISSKIMFFDALEVQEHPQSDSGSIWDY